MKLAKLRLIPAVVDESFFAVTDFSVGFLERKKKPKLTNKSLGLRYQNEDTVMNE